MTATTTTQIPSAPYDHNIYHIATKPSLHEATATFASRNVQHYINTVIRDCFLKHQVHKLFSVCLLHRHFDLGPNERNIEEKGQATASTDWDNTHACSWLYHNGSLFPYEFKRGMVALPTPPGDFVTELGVILQEHGLCDIIGLQVYEYGVVGMESTDHGKRISNRVTYKSQNTIYVVIGVTKRTSGTKILIQNPDAADQIYEVKMDDLCLASS
ncbi:hypothetical protein BDV25DRAFT_142428 [Aspergillus avenaceus]|uniref:Uncharacterized protein n=1 Tax=Aspergillus avenaceus TaxID=36643 RepID=A0A5N6TNA0_ASPAV|nr:hypothetical protein BDV25DRAFT_142428 [Aspergillus avenaceus]